MPTGNDQPGCSKSTQPRLRAEIHRKSFRAHGPFVRFGQTFHRTFADFLLFAVISSDRKVEETGKKKNAIQNIMSLQNLDQHQQLHFTISHSFRHVLPKANLQNPTNTGMHINKASRNSSLPWSLGKQQDHLALQKFVRAKSWVLQEAARLYSFRNSMGKSWKIS